MHKLPRGVRTSSPVLGGIAEKCLREPTVDHLLVRHWGAKCRHGAHGDGVAIYGTGAAPAPSQEPTEFRNRIPAGTGHSNALPMWFALTDSYLFVSVGHSCQREDGRRRSSGSRLRAARVKLRSARTVRP